MMMLVVIVMVVGGRGYFTFTEAFYIVLDSVSYYIGRESFRESTHYFSFSDMSLGKKPELDS